MKYIDADPLRKEVKRLEKSAHRSALGCADSETRKFHEGKDFAYQHVGILIDSLQQEQPEGDFEKEVDKLWQEGVNGLFGFNDSAVDFARIRNIALHFYELGKSSK